MNCQLLFFGVFLAQSLGILQAAEPSFNNKRPKNPLWDSTWKDKLKQDLLLHYDKFTRPSFEGNKTSVNVDFVLRHIELDEQKFVLTVHCWMNMKWNDDKIRWNTSDYNGLKEIHLAEHEIWQPDIFPYNSASGSSLDHFGNTNLIAYSNGSVLWVPPTIFKVFCTMDFTWWPFDTQVCTLKFGSWTYNGEQIDLINANEGKIITEMPLLAPSPQWEFVQMTVVRNLVLYPCCSTPYPDLTFTFTVRRHSATYKALIITPTVAVVLITLVSFLLPPPFADKLILLGTAIIINSMILIFFMYMMPSMAFGTTPNIVSFYSTCMYLLTFAIVVSMIVSNVASNPKNIALPWILKRNLSSWLGKCLFIKTSDDKNFSKAEEMTDSQPVLPDQGRQQSSTSAESYQGDWILLATALDRIFFFVFAFSFLILALVHYV